ncbi:MAG: hypothetical protein P8X57_05420 [Cyclobacteriaceae bacterium]
MTAAGITAAGLAAHSIVTNIRKRKLISRHVGEGKEGLEKESES